jgi:hypothetical protein
LKSGKYPKDFYSPQSNEFYELTDIDLLQLYALLTPSEIIKEFGKRSRCEKSIYNLIHKYRLDRPLKARQYLEKIILAACPEEIGFEDWEILLKTKLSYVRAEALMRMWKRIDKHESFWKIE